MIECKMETSSVEGECEAGKTIVMVVSQIGEIRDRLR